jgi:hypothetical protein
VRRLVTGYPGSSCCAVVYLNSVVFSYNVLHVYVYLLKYEFLGTSKLRRVY